MHRVVLAAACASRLALGGDVLVDSLPALRAAAAAAVPGDRIVLASGAYQGSIHVDRLRGEEGRPITIVGADPPPVLRGDGIHFVAPSWVTLENIIIEGATGNGLNIDDGAELENPARDLTVRNVHVRDVGPEGNCDGIKLSGLAGFRVEGCTIERWGRGGSGIDMVGCRDGTISTCTLRHGDTDGSSGIQAKGGSRDITIRSCRFEHAGRRALNIGGSTGLPYFRPGPAGFEAANITVERCVIVGSEAAIAFVGVDGADVRWNTIYHPRRWVLRILQETREPGFAPCRNGRFRENLVVFDVASARNPNVGDATDPGSFSFAGNVWYCDTDASTSTPALPVPESGGVYGLDPRLADPGRGDYTPAADGPGARAGATR